ncbi:MAG TPA: tRNA guanosine(15) transglycosylase TgtA [Candidatus Krumholzibacteriaceae bacterium]|jgi:7-cyano-7-deazaguanine tRNA-ribosyltransferase|nr:tRNA guanosine(15) transglycosylase TgtA [Candidatus Krumholzibacteriaceae bacterium]
MAFEVREKDLLGRIGKLETKSGFVETPVLLPVINPRIQPIKPSEMKELFGCKALITNAYIVQRNFGQSAVEREIHRLLDYDGVVMTDSGAYQILVYGDVQVDADEIVSFQEQINTDIATILDVPTGWRVSKEYANETVKETLRRARRLWKTKTRDDVLWVGPVQGGQYLELVAKSARKMGVLPFHIHALGSPTAVMEQYFFDVLVDMVMAAKMNLPVERPLHLFGAGHPFMFSLAVALGCDLFDSAAYALFAREDRYMTENGTARLSELEYLPCSCSVCVKNSSESLLEKPKAERQRLLAEHNLFVSFAELRRVKQAILEGRLWEYLEMRAHAHPSLLRALKRLKKYEDYFEENSPVTKNSGLFFFDSVGLVRPEVVRYRKRMKECYSPLSKAEVLLLLSQTDGKPFHKSREWHSVLSKLYQTLSEKSSVVHVCFYAAPFGVVPVELDEVYPLSQHEVVIPLDNEVIAYVAEQVATYIARTNYKQVVLLEDHEVWGKEVARACRRVCEKKGIAFVNLKREGMADRVLTERILSTLKLGV